MKSSTRPKAITVALAVATVFYLGLIGYLVRANYLRFTEITTEEEPIATLPQPVTVEPEPTVTEEPVAAPVVLPTAVNLTVPFTSQAPFAIWDALHEETCEEASLLMVRQYGLKTAFTSPASVDEELKSLVDWQTKHGYKVDVTLTELKQIAADYYQLKTGRIIENPTLEDIQRELAANRPVILPAAGRLLENPNFTNGGPRYHMLVIRGYDATGFITNDPGTRRGEGFRYTFTNLMESMHDWNPTDILQGRKAVLVFD